MFNLFRRARAVPPAVVARHVESDRMREAKLVRAREARAAALQFARAMEHVSEPMTPREQIAAEVAAQRARRKRRARA